MKGTQPSKSVSTSNFKAGNVLVTPLLLQRAVGIGDHLPSDKGLIKNIKTPSCAIRTPERDVPAVLISRDVFTKCFSTSQYM